jgi:hypothetical protein
VARPVGSRRTEASGDGGMFRLSVMHHDVWGRRICTAPNHSLPDRCTYRSSCQLSSPAPRAIMQKSSHNRLGVSITGLRTQRFVDSAIHASPNFRQHKTDNSPAPLGPAEQKIALVYKYAQALAYYTVTRRSHQELMSGFLFACSRKHQRSTYTGCSSY